MNSRKNNFKGKGDAVGEILYYPPPNFKDLRREYPELATIEEFANISNDEMLFVY